MILFDLRSNEAVFPFENDRVMRMARRWGVKRDQIEEAIIQTGSLKRAVIRDYLAKKGVVFSFSGFFFLTRKRWKVMISKLNEEEQYA
jgi:hypothetical protein